jgi:1-acyl-sn-glycerol-3-phosphate acyltransferase
VNGARWRLLSLWLSQTARVFADTCLRIFVVLQLARVSSSDAEGAWALVTFLLMLPAVFLAPLNGALGNTLSKPAVLIGSAFYCGAVVTLFAALDGPWLACWALLAIGTSVYGPVRYAFLPAAADDTRLPLTRINGWIELGVAAAIMGGLILGIELTNVPWLDLPGAVTLALALSLLALIAALPVRFPSDRRRPEAPGRALAGFFRDLRRILANGEARATLIGLAGLRGVLTALTNALIAAVLVTRGIALEELVQVGVWLALGVGVGAFVASLQRHPRRALGLVPLGGLGMLVGLLLPALDVLPSPALCIVVGSMWGLVNVPLAATYQASLPADARGNGMAVRNLCDYLGIAVMAGLLFVLVRTGMLSVAGQFWLIALLAGVGVAFSWRLWFRELMEQVLELLIWPMYRIRSRGPGLEHFPMQGPALVIANHSAWLDPMWLAKVLPRRLIPLMTSVFYDLPVIRLLMVHVAQAIRVQASTFRREAPELREAIAALDRGEVVILFPEGQMRRHEDVPVRQFGQGVWHILTERPQTPVIVCWIEGGWGCFFSYFKGKPTKNKRLDFRRKIDIAVGRSRILDPDLLKDHRETRMYLMRECLETRRILDLEPLPAPSLAQSVEPLSASE